MLKIRPAVGLAAVVDQCQSEVHGHTASLHEFSVSRECVGAVATEDITEPRCGQSLRALARRAEGADEGELRPGVLSQLLSEAGLVGL